jgi:hypothetical protein
MRVRLPRGVYPELTEGEGLTMTHGESIFGANSNDQNQKTQNKERKEGEL